MLTLRRFSPNVRTLVAAVLALFVTAVASLFIPRATLGTTTLLVADPIAVAIPSTTTAPPPPPTTVAPHLARKRAARPAQHLMLAPVVLGSDFWARLARCESGGNPQASGKYHGAFQFALGTWHSAGGTGLPEQHTYEEQLVVAQRHAANIHPREGTRAGWPVCWWKALRD